MLHLVLLVCVFSLLFSSSTTTANKTVIPVGCVWSEGAAWGGSWLSAPHFAMMQAVNEVNADESLLTNYTIEVTCNTTWYSSAAAAEIGVWNFNRGSVAILGVALSSEATPLSYIASAKKIPILSTSASSASLNNAIFPSFQRLYPSDVSQVGILLSFCRHFGWKNLVIVYTSDDYGRAFSLEMSKVKQNDVAITMLQVPYSEDYAHPTDDIMEHYRLAGQTIKTLDIRIVFLMITTAPWQFLKAFSRVPGLLKQSVIVLNQDTDVDFSDIDSVPEPDFVRAQLGGIFAIKVSTEIQAEEDVLKAKAEGFRNLPDFGKSGDVYCQNAYDSVLVLAQTLHALTKDSTEPGFLPPNEDVVNYIRSNSFSGTGGLIRFCGADRIPLNFDIYNMPHGELVMRRVLTASTDNKCPDQDDNPANYSIYTVTVIEDAESPVFASGLTTIPIDKPIPHIEGLQTGAVAASLALICLGLFLCLLGFILIQIHSRTKVIKGSSVLFCNLILIGVMIALVGLAIETLYDRSQAYACMLVPALLALSFDVTFGSLFAKTWRLMKIFQNAQHLKKSVITNTQVFLPVFALILFDLLVISLWAGIDVPSIALELDPIRSYTLVQRCDMEQKTAWFALLIVPKLGVLIYGMQVSYQVRNIDKIFRESNSIAVCIIALFLCGAITTPILLLVWQQIDAAQVLLTIGVTLSLVSVILVLFVPKFWRIYHGEGETSGDKTPGTLDMSTTSHSWKADSRGGAPSVAEEVMLKKKEAGSGPGSRNDEPPSPKSPSSRTEGSKGEFPIISPSALKFVQNEDRSDPTSQTEGVAIFNPYQETSQV